MSVKAKRSFSGWQAVKLWQVEGLWLAQEAKIDTDNLHMAFMFMDCFGVVSEYLTEKLRRGKSNFDL